MTRRAQLRRFAAGELGGHELEALLAEAEDDPALADALAEVDTPLARAELEPEGPPAPPPDLVDRSVLRGLEQRALTEQSPPWRRLLAGQPLVLRTRPLGLAVALAAAAALLLWARQPPPSGTAPASSASASIASVAVRLVLPAEGAERVAVAGDFNGWSTDDVLLEDPEGDGVFVGLLRLPPGSYAYMFVIDGERWVTDPYAVTHRDDGFGNRNAVLRID